MRFFKLIFDRNKLKKIVVFSAAIESDDDIRVSISYFK